jgi:hypothetical protein
MALEATHIRFALELKDEYKITDIPRYVAGTVYPDSRYVTKIDRNLTHPEDYASWDLEQADDFRKGWYVHLLCDRIQWRVLNQITPFAFQGTTGPGSEQWINGTALKILLDMDDVRKFDIKSVLPFLDHLETPNHEDPDKMSHYHRIIKKLYADPDDMNITKYQEMWKGFGISDELGSRVKTQTESYAQDGRVTPQIERLFAEMLSNHSSHH